MDNITLAVALIVAFLFIVKYNRINAALQIKLSQLTKRQPRYKNTDLEDAYNKGARDAIAYTACFIEWIADNGLSTVVRNGQIGAMYNRIAIVSMNTANGRVTVYDAMNNKIEYTDVEKALETASYILACIDAIQRKLAVTYENQALEPGDYSSSDWSS